MKKNITILIALLVVSEAMMFMLGLKTGLRENKIEPKKEINACMMPAELTIIEITY